MDEVLSPQGVAVGPNRNLYVVEASSRAHVSVWSRTIALLTWFRDHGTCGQLHTPGQVAVDASRSIYITHAGDHRIQKFTADGRFLASIGRGQKGCQRFAGQALRRRARSPITPDEKHLRPQQA